MSTFKKTKVVMLPTNKKATVGSIVTRPSDNRMAIVNVLTKDDTQPCIHQHLYFLSDKPIKEGDWYYEPFDNGVRNASFNFEKSCSAKKIIATTNKSLKIITGIVGSGTGFTLFQPSPSFIEKFVEEYNKGNQITEVLVEYERDEEIDGYGYDTLKVNSKDNTITIRKAKDSWNREEVELLCLNAIRDTLKSVNLNSNKTGELIDTDKWIEKNL